ncbi:MAG: hypothetical protein ABEH90_01605 [Halolamina sp.]
MQRATFGALLAVLLVTGAAAAVLLQPPEASVANAGEWGKTDAGTPTVTVTVQVRNQPGLGLNRRADASYTLALNGVAVASAGRTDIDVSGDTSTVRLTASIREERLGRWWAAFVRANETVSVRAEPHLTVRTGPVRSSPTLSGANRTLLGSAMPFRGAFTSVASVAEGEYVRNVSEDTLRSEVADRYIDQSRLDRRRNDSTTENVTVGYEVRRGWATWGEVTAEHTTLRLHFLLYNPSSIVSLPVDPTAFDLVLGTSERTLFRAESATVADAGSYAERGGTPVLEPREISEVVYVVRLDNENVSDWVAGHVSRGERTTLGGTLAVRYDLGPSAVRLPAAGRLSHACELQTGMLSDQETLTTCRSLTDDGESGSDDGDTGVPGGKQRALGRAVGGN